MACAECHDHPFDEFTRKDFFQVAAFLNGMKGNPTRDGLLYKFYKKDVIIAAHDGDEETFDAYLGDRKNTLNLAIKLVSPNYFRGQGTGQIALPADYQYSNGKPKQIIKGETPNFGISARIKSQQGLTGGNKGSLDQLAQWVTADNNNRFAANLANRIWKRIMGTSLYANKDFYEDSKSLPYNELVEALINAVKKLNYDSRVLEHALVMTRTFNFQSYKDYAFDGSFEMLQGRQLRRMSAQQIWDSLVVLKVPNMNLVVPEKYSETPQSIDFWPVKGKLYNRQSIKDLLDNHLQSTKTLDDYEEFLAKLKITMKDVAQPIENKGSFVPSSQQSSPANNSIMGLFGQSPRREINASNNYANMSQALELLNGTIQKEIVHNESSAINQIIAQAKTPQDKINKLYLALYNRLPDSWEKQMCLDLVREKGSKAYKLILSTLICSSEFMFVQ